MKEQKKVAIPLNTAKSFRLSDVTNEMLQEYRIRYARLTGDEKRVELVSFRCGESLMNKIEDHCSENPGISQSMLVSDLVALGLSVFNNLKMSRS